MRGTGGAISSPVPSWRERLGSAAGTRPGSAVPASTLRLAAARNPAASARPPRVLGSVVVRHLTPPIRACRDAGRRPQEAAGPARVRVALALSLGARGGQDHAAGDHGRTQCSEQQHTCNHDGSPFNAFSSAAKRTTPGTWYATTYPRSRALFVRRACPNASHACGTIRVFWLSCKTEGRIGRLRCRHGRAAALGLSGAGASAPTSRAGPAGGWRPGPHR
jgi:hypothetical protein